ncbi:MAG: DUF2510 domain-containing protein [Ilumatobacter sp.]|jgi:hypothetical protein|uniref:DUF2510 domain-containing protein n=1 Tax=Ilumatobacter sp. TaxID=1967498 RepID=UPI00391C41A8
MRYVDAPPAGWYPDPDGQTRLRWWDGFDWTDIRRAPPSDAELIAAEENRAFYERNEVQAREQRYAQVPAGPLGRQDVQEIIAEVRNVARSELDRAANEFSNRATAAVRGFTPLISSYTSTLTKWVKRAVIIAIVLLVAYFVFQVVVQASVFEWIGDRIDNLTDEQSGSAPPPLLRWWSPVS